MEVSLRVDPRQVGDIMTTRYRVWRYHGRWYVSGDSGTHIRHTPFLCAPSLESALKKLQSFIKRRGRVTPDAVVWKTVLDGRARSGSKFMFPPT